MGIKHLNNICKKYCKNSYTSCHLSQIKNQTIIIDTNLYMYKFKKTNSLEMDFEIMCNKFVKFNITPLFVFNGNAPQDKFHYIEKKK